MNIGIITSSFPSHPEDLVQAPFLIDFVEGLTKRGHGVFVFTQDRKGIKKEFLKGVGVTWFSWRGSGRPLVHLSPFHPGDLLRIADLFLKGRRALLPFIRENRIDACLALWVLPGGYFARYAHQRSGVPYSVWALGSDIYQYGKAPFVSGIMRRIIQDAKGVFADGFDLADRVEERFGRKCFFLATTRTLSKEKARERGEKKGNGSPYRFLFVGRLEKVKGIDLLLRSMAMLKKEVRNIHLTVVGKGTMDDWVRGFIEKEKLGEKVAFMGNVPDETLISLYSSTDCTVIPSRSESIPLVFSEALNFDTEMIVTDVGDMGRLGRDYAAAWVIPPEDPVALKEMMRERAVFRETERKQEPRARRAELKHL